MHRFFVFIGLLFCSCLVSSVEAETPVKNVLFLISDDLKASALGCYGNEICKTPNIDKLASQGMVFDRAYCQGTSCGPSRRSFMRSRYRDKDNLTLGEHFQNNGVYTGRVGKIFHMRVPGDIIAGTNGEDVEACWTERFNTQGREAHTVGDYSCLNLNIFTRDEENRQSTRMPHRMFVSVEYEGDGSDQPDFQAAKMTVSLLNQKKAEPFFLATGFVRPHYPSVAPTQYFAPYPFANMPLPEMPEGDLDDIPKAGIPGLTNASSGIGKYPENIQRMWSAYYATVTYMDEQVGKVLDELDRLGLRESTVVVFTSDHGYHLGEHTFWQKSNLHEESTRVPLIISAPGFEAGRSGSLAELVDIYPTLCELTGKPIPKAVEGSSLVSILKDPSEKVNETAVSFVQKGKGWRFDDWAYMRYKDGSEELYDMKADPGQFTNLAEKEDSGEVLERMRKLKP